MNGPDMFTYQQLESWARLTGQLPMPHEVTALMHLGAIYLYPPKEEEE